MVYVMVVIVLFGVILFMCVCRLDVQTPYAYLKKYGAKGMASPTELIYQETLTESTSIVFYVQQDKKFACTILKKTLAGYKIIPMGSTSNLDEIDTFLYNSTVIQDWQKQKKTIVVCWGIITDNAVSSVMLAGESCTIVNIPHREDRLYWVIGEWEDSPTSDQLIKQ